MAVSQNGWVANNRALIHSVTVPGTSVSLPVRIGSAGDLLIWAAARWHREVEPLHDGWNWGYAERPIRGGTDLSNHASGTAIDLNAPAHPLGTNPASNFSPAKIAAIRRIIADAGPALRWGGDYTGRKDGMHVEVVGNEAQCTAVLARVSAAPSSGGDVILPDIHPGDGVKGAPNGRGKFHWYVLSVQGLLNLRGLSHSLVVDGSYGAETTALVKELQTRSKVAATGSVDAATWPWLIGNEAPDFI